MLSEKEREERIKENLKLVHACAKRFKGRGIEYDDLFQAGCIGLIKSVDGFDESKGFAFSTYAVPVILGEIKGAFRSGGAIKISRSIKEKGIAAMALRQAYIDKFGREPTVSELAERLGISPQETVEVLGSLLPMLSLTAADDDEKEIDVGIPSHEKSVSDSIAISQCMEQLPEQERKIIEYRYFKELTQSEVAKRLGITQVQVSRKEKRALLKMREMLR